MIEKTPPGVQKASWKYSAAFYTPPRANISPCADGTATKLLGIAKVFTLSPSAQCSVTISPRVLLRRSIWFLPLSYIRRQSAARKSSRMCISTGCFSWEKGHICFSLRLSGSLSVQSGQNGSTQCSLWHHHLCAEINILSRTAFNDLREFSLECPWRGKIISCQQQKWMGWSDTHFSISSACVVQLTE